MDVQVLHGPREVSFWRWPITDEQSPEERDFEVLLDILLCAAGA